MKIHILTDSLGGPRIANEETVNFENTWISKVTKKFNKFDFSYLVRHSLNTSEITNNINKYLAPYSADYNIIQVGIVDSFPRVLLKNERFIILKLPFNIGKNIILKMIRRYYNNITSIYYRNEVNFDNFQRNIRLISSNFKCQFIPIIPPSLEYLKICSKAEDSIKRYNSVLHENCFDTEKFGLFCEKLNNKNGELVISDHHHLNNAGHEKISIYLESILGNV